MNDNYIQREEIRREHCIYCGAWWEDNHEEDCPVIVGFELEVGTLVRFHHDNTTMGIVTKIGEKVTHVNRFKWDPTLEVPDNDWKPNEEVSDWIKPVLNGKAVRAILGEMTFKMVISTEMRRTNYQILKANFPELYHKMFRMLTP